MGKLVSFFLQSFVLYLAIKAYQKLTINNNKTDIGIDDTNRPNNLQTSLSLNASSLGRHTWAVLHSIAASYPNKPNKTEQKAFDSFFNGFTQRYPCIQHRNAFKAIVNTHPIEQGSREELVYYICELHNIVNAQAKEKKPKFNCRLAFDIWGGDCGCDS